MSKALKMSWFHLYIIALVLILSYWRILGYFFTGRDLPVLIMTSNVPLSQILSTGLAGGQRFFRPVSSLSYALDFWLFGLDPAGWHLTSIVIHIATALFVYIFVRVSLDKKSIYALLAALIFSIHPATAQNVPDLSSRMDLLATLFGLASLTFFVYAERQQDRNARLIYRSISLLAFLLGALSKEIGLVTVFVVGVYLLVVSVNDSPIRQFLSAIREILPYVATAGVVFIWRTWVLGDPLGRVTQSLSSDTFVPWLKNVASYTVTYLWLLLFPQFSNPSDFESNQIAGFLSANKWVLFLGVIFLLTSVLGLWYTSSKKRCALGLSRYESQLTRYILFLLLWLLLILGVFLATLFRQRYMYPAVVPFAILLSIACVAGFEALTHRLLKHAGTSAPVGIDLFLSPLPILILVQLFYLSPLLHSYDAWEKNGKMAQELIARLGEVQGGSTVFVENLPDPRWTPNLITPQPKEIGNIWIPAYQRLFYGDKDVKWCIKSIVAGNQYYQPFKLSKLPDGNFILHYEIEPEASRTDYSGCCQQFSCQ